MLIRPVLLASQKVWGNLASAFLLGLLLLLAFLLILWILYILWGKKRSAKKMSKSVFLGAEKDAAQKSLLRRQFYSANPQSLLDDTLPGRRFQLLFQLEETGNELSFISRYNLSQSVEPGCTGGLTLVPWGISDIFPGSTASLGGIFAL